MKEFLSYFTIALVALAIVIGLIVNALRKENTGRYIKGACVFLSGFAFAVAVIMLYNEIRDMVNGKEIYAEVFYPILAALIAIVILAVAGVIIYMTKPEKVKIFKYVALGVGSAAIIAIVAALSVYYKNEIIPGGYYQVNNIGLIVGTVVIALILILVPVLFGNKTEDSTKSISYAAVCIALSFALSYMRLFKLPQGGSITLASLVPLMFYSYKFGIRKGVTAGIIYGLLQAIQDPYIIHPAQILLDYPLAFGGIGLAGLFKEKKVFKNDILNFLFGALLGVAIRYASHVLSGIFAFSVYAADAGYDNAVIYSFVYNSFALADMAISMIVGAIMLTSRTFKKTLDA